MCGALVVLDQGMLMQMLLYSRMQGMLDPTTARAILPEHVAAHILQAPDAPVEQVACLSRVFLAVAANVTNALAWRAAGGLP
jgi:hypothetical protein